MMTSVYEIAPDVYRLCTYNPGSNLQFCQFLFKDDEPLLFHTGHRRLFQDVREAVARVLDPATLRWIGHSHFEADECGSLNEWLQEAPHAEPFCSLIGARTSLLCSDLLLQHGDVAPFTDQDVLGPVAAALKAQHASPTGDSLPYTTETESTLESLARTAPRALATPHGSTYIGDGARALRDLIQVIRDVHNSKSSAGIRA